VPRAPRHPRGVHQAGGRSAGHGALTRAPDRGGDRVSSLYDRAMHRATVRGGRCLAGMHCSGWLMIAGIAGACARPAPVQPIAPPPPPAPMTPAPPPAKASPWAGLPVRVMTWTPHGVQQIGELPGELPQPMP